MLGIAAVMSVAAQPLPAEVRVVIDAAVASGDAQAVATVSRFARQAHPGAAAEIEAIETAFQTANNERQAAATRERQAQLAAANLLDNWTGQIELGASRSTGRTDSLGFLGALSLERQGLRWRHNLAARAEIQETNDVRSTERILLSWQPRLRLDERFYAFGLTQYDHDPFIGFDDRYTLGLGAGYALIATPKARLDLEGGPAVRREHPVTGGATTSIAARASADFRWQIAPTLELKQNGSIYLEDANRSGSATTALDTRLLGDWRIRLSYELRYERAALGEDFVDTTSRATLLYNF
jgi:putative salt-induced outer membrane protein